MKGADLKAFRKANDLTQSELGEYLGVKKSFVSQMESEKCAIPLDKFSKLLNNPYGWDTSMLTASEPGSEPSQSQESILIAELRAKIEQLETKIDHLNQEIGEKNALLKLMNQGGGASAQAADGSSVASAG